MIGDDVKSLYRKIQDVLTRSGLDSWNRVTRVGDFYEKVVKVFNNQLFLPHTAALPDLHEHFAISKPLPLKEDEMMRDRVKDILVGFGQNYPGL